MKDINLKNKKKIDNNCQCLCHFDTKQLLSSVKYCDRCIEIHKTEPISPFKPNGWEETEKVLLKSFRDSCVIGFHTIGIGTVPCWINDVIKPLLSQAILSAEKETVKRCIEALPKKKNIDIEIPDTLHRNVGFNQAIDQAISAISNKK